MHLCFFLIWGCKMFLGKLLIARCSVITSLFKNFALLQQFLRYQRNRLSDACFIKNIVKNQHVNWLVSSVSNKYSIREPSFRDPNLSWKLSYKTPVQGQWELFRTNEARTEAAGNIYYLRLSIIIY